MLDGGRRAVEHTDNEPSCKLYLTWSNMARVENINLTRVSANVGNRNARVDGCVLRSFWKRCCPNVVTIATGLKPVFLILGLALLPHFIRRLPRDQSLIIFTYFKSR